MELLVTQQPPPCSVSSELLESSLSAPPRGPVCRFILKGPLEDQNNPQAGQDTSDLVQKLRSEVQQLTEQNAELKKVVHDTKITPDSFAESEEKVKYFTGLPNFLTLMAFFELLEPHIIHAEGRSCLSKFQQLIMVLMKLRHSSPLQDLAYRFNISKSTASRVYNSVINVMYHRMQQFIYWPEREYLQMSMPMEFRKTFGVKIAIIIDCFEIFIERPSSLLARAQTWSNYKHHNTVKFLIGITPQGAVSFLSKAWGGRASDKQITENSGLLSKLLPGDVILADRGFNISESVGLMCAQVKIPAFTRGKKQLSPLEVEATRKIAHVRIHVERVIGLVRNKYTILRDILPVDYLQNETNQVPLIDKIVTVCCALSNLCPSVIPFD